MFSEAILKCLCWCLLLLWANEKIIYLNPAAASVIVNENPLWTRRDNNFILIQQLQKDVQRPQQAAAKTQTFLELILGIVDTLQFGKRKIGATNLISQSK